MTGRAGEPGATMASTVNPTPLHDIGLSLGETNYSEAENLTNLTYGVVGIDPTLPTGRNPLVTLTVPAIMFACGVLGNLLAIVVLFRSSNEHKQTVFYRLVGALAVTDLFGTCATSPVSLLVYSNNLKWVGGQSLCDYDSFMMIFAGDATLFIVGAMAVDRFVAIKHPFFYDKNVTYSKAKFVILGLWLLAAFIACLPFMGLGKAVVQFPGTWCFFSFTSTPVENQIFAYGYAIIGLFVVGLTAISNTFVTFSLLQMRRKARKTMGGSSKKRHDSELQMMVLLLGITVIFSTCWCPFMIRIIVNQSNFRQVDRSADLMALRLASLNQILDPWIYILFRKEMFIRGVRLFKDMCFPWCACSCSRAVTKQRVRCSRVESKKEKNVSGCEAFPLECQYHECTATVHDREPQAEAVMRPVPGRQSRADPNSLVSCSLYLKHSSCLFCFAKHPKSLVSTASGATSKSDEVLNLVGTHSIKADGEAQLCSCGHGECIKATKRDSIHLSLTDLRQEHQTPHVVPIRECCNTDECDGYG